MDGDQKAIDQAFFDKTVAHLRKQGVKSEDTFNGQCRYRAGKLMCAIGCHIPDEVYDPMMEAKSLENLRFSQFWAAVEPYLTASCQLMRDLQGVHDDVLTREWERELERVAVLYGLEWRAAHG